MVYKVQSIKYGHCTLGIHFLNFSKLKGKLNENLTHICHVKTQQYIEANVTNATIVAFLELERFI